MRRFLALAALLVLALLPGAASAQTAVVDTPAGNSWMLSNVSGGYGTRYVTGRWLNVPTNQDPPGVLLRRMFIVAKTYPANTYAHANDTPGNPSNDLYNSSDDAYDVKVLPTGNTTENFAFTLRSIPAAPLPTGAPSQVVFWVMTESTASGGTITKTTTYRILMNIAGMY
jgi:hypothetical protein